MGPEQQRLMDRLFNDPTRKIRNFNFTLGDKPGITKEELCHELNKALDESEKRWVMVNGKPYDGSCGRPLTREDVGPARSMKPPVDVRELVKNLED